MYLNSAWRRCSERFDEVNLFIDASSGLARTAAAPSFRSDLYGSWVLMAYAACQFSLVEIGRGTMAFLGQKYKHPASMPGNVLRAHEKMTLDGIRRLVEGDAKSQALVRQTLKDIYSSNWSTTSKLLKMDRNVWPNNVKEWLKRLGVEDSEMSWMKDTTPGTSETYESRMAELVEERNPIAHGQSPSQLLTAQLMKDWLGECREFMERCAMTVEWRLAIDHKPRLRTAGSVDKALVLGNKTVPIVQLSLPLRVGDHVLLASAGQRKKVARVEALYSNMASYQELPAGHQAVAVGLSKTHQACGIFLVP
ncbi:HEPN domain-containing protein [Kitasatospora sp. NPDC096140]|uniref:HEPN domain-containing protein n=1 Tax=Kitasatospora sp. NPDC096140 TaxID=3155425 RepID=UPI003333272E